jgi:hypothetical protein
MMGRKILFAVLLALLLSLLAVSAQNYSDTEDLVKIEATVIGFNTDNQQNFITLYIDNITGYQRAEGANFSRLTPNRNITLGFLWGHRPITVASPKIDVGDRIIALIGYHREFSSHTGHVYSYELICEKDEVKIGDVCAPAQCADNEMRSGSICKPLVCGEDSYAKNHTCQKLNCASYEEISDHSCVVLECAPDESAKNHLCQKLACGPNSIIRNNACVPIFCGVFSKAGGQNCVFDWSQLFLVIVISGLFLYFIYDMFIRGIVENKKKGDTLLASRFIVLIVLVISLAVISVPVVSRLIFHGDLLVGGESYHNVDIARKLMIGEIRFDPLDKDMGAYHLLVAYLGSAIGIENSARLISIVLSALSACLFYLIARRLINDLRTAIIVTLIFIFSPVFLYLAIFSVPDTLVIFLILTAVLLSLSGRGVPLLISGAILIGVSTHSIFSFAFAAAVSLMLLIHLKNHRRLRVALLILLVIGGVAYHLVSLHNNAGISGFRSDLAREAITDFGGLIGFGIFHIIVAVVGLFSTWKNKKEYTVFYVLLAGLFLVSILMNTNYNAYLNLVMAYLVGIGLISVAKRQWNVALLKNIVLLILFCGLLFSTLSYAKRASDMGPDPEMVSSLKWLSVLSNGKVFSYPGYSDYITYFGRKPAMIGTGQSENTIQLLNITTEIFYSRRLEYTKSLLSEQNISYIVIDNKMRQGLVWMREDQGLLFLLRNNETFRKIYSGGTSEIWEYLPQVRE